MIRTARLHNGKYYYNILKVLYICKNKEIFTTLRDNFYTKLFIGSNGKISIENNDNHKQTKYSYWYELEWRNNHDSIIIDYPSELKGLHFNFEVNFINNIIEITIKKG